MNFSELYSEVLNIVKRPDLTDRINSAIRAATLKVHHSDFYYKDLVEKPVQFDEARFLQSFIPSSILPRYRKAKYIRFWRGDINGSPGKFFEPIQIENSMDSYDYIKTDVFYMAGQALQMRSSEACQRVLFGAYLHPLISPSTEYQSWIADEYPYAIIYEAARTIFRSIGFQEQAAEYDRLGLEVLSEIKLSCVDDLPLT